MATNPNVSFLRGLHANLPAAGRAVDGVFYLTTDTHRLYVGQGTELVDLNKYIKTVATTNNLPDPTNPANNVAIGDFYYVEDKNLLVVYKGGESFQLINQNTDHRITEGSFSAGTDNTVALTLVESDGGKEIAAGAFKFVGADGVEVAVANDNGIPVVTIDGTTYALSTSSNVTEGKTTDFTVTLTGSDESTSTFVVKPGANVTIDRDASGALVINSSYVDTYLESAAVAVNDNGEIELTLTHNSGAQVTAKSGAIKYGVGGVDYVPGSALPVYTKDEIDSKLNGLDAMTYKGTVGVGGSAGADLPTEGVKIGDTYLAVSAVVYATDKAAKKGDLLIATLAEGATEINGVIPTGSVVWSWVPAGDDAQTDTTYTFEVDAANNSVHLKESSGAVEGSFDLDEGESGKILISSEASTDGKGLTTTIEHAPINAAGKVEATPETAVDDATVVTAVTGVTVDSTGHVTGFTTKQHSLMGYELEGAAVVEASGDDAGHKVTVTDTLKDSSGKDCGTSSFTLASGSTDNLKVRKGAGAGDVVISFEWGSF